jgi:hypothetical protein
LNGGEEVVRWTVRAALALYAAAVVLRFDPAVPSGSRRAARILWTLGCVACLAHVAAAFGFAHGWSHAAAWEHTARRTREVVGIDSGGGIWANHLFTLLWIADAAWWWSSRATYEARTALVERFAQGTFATMVFFAAVVFGAGPARWIGTAVLLVLTATWLRRVRSDRRLRDS